MIQRKCSRFLLMFLFQTYNCKVVVNTIEKRVSDPGQYDAMFSPTFNIGDLIDDLDMMMPAFNATIEEQDEVYNDIPGFALDPEDFLLAADPKYDDLASPVEEEDPITMGANFEGDIKNVDITEIRAMYDAAANDETWMRNAIKDEWRKWPGGVVPYVISSRYSRYERGIIAKAMKEYKTKTCIR